ncbi:unnamed protein product [Oncorhynchus mykiss]|uniref:LIM zinc-binding domain-containing protein n=1 Tax=Oncorhynchus mykiss TaxID=8022 RepID=A0A060XVY7_ONCMY|nr:unnamed protein product [Oncorhynchus mykiss]
MFMLMPWKGHFQYSIPLGPGCNEESCPQGAVWPCAGCGESIRDPVVLRVGSNQQWHTGCLCCDECHCPLGESVSCFLRDGRTLCRTDYARFQPLVLSFLTM